MPTMSVMSAKQLVHVIIPATLVAAVVHETIIHNVDVVFTFKN